jgi:hypothetical protein
MRAVVTLALAALGCGGANPTREPAPIRRASCADTQVAPATARASRAAIDSLGAVDSAAVAPLESYAPPPPPGWESGLELADEMSDTPAATGRVAAYRETVDRYSFVEATLTDAGRGSGDLDAWAHELLLQREPHATREEGLEAYRRILVYLAVWTDAHGRANLEYAIVMKGCERLERYIRISQEAGPRLTVELAFYEQTPPDRAARHLRRFFDEPLATPPPSERIFAYGHSTNL